ncbi:MAG: AbrB family transcriptional regulator [Gammaproteobacteria bacterium]|nr:MAG: AbrB family transcriptional regulator [Gammaproteobacteria bacterium]
MAKVSAKRQITLPVDQCVVACINAGDQVDSFVDRQGVISIVKKQPGAAKGLLKDVVIDTNISEQASLESAIDK